MHEVTRIDKRLFDLLRTKGKAGAMALAFAIKFKYLMPSSVIKGYTVDKMAKLMHCSYTTVKKSITILTEAGLIRIFYRGKIKYLEIKPLRRGKMLRCKNQDVRKLKPNSGKLHCFTPKAMDVVIEHRGFDRRNLFQIVKILQEYTLVKYAIGKEVCGELIRLNNLHKTSRKENHPKRASETTLVTNKQFTDYGKSYESIARDMGVGRSTAAKRIKDACMRNLVKRCPRVFYEPVSGVNLNPAYKLQSNYHTYYTKTGQMVCRAANIYLPMLGENWYRSILIEREIGEAVTKSKQKLLQKTISSLSSSSYENNYCGKNINPIV